MIIIKQFLHDVPTNSVEVTWVARTVAPDTVIAEVHAVFDAEGVETAPAIPARTEPGAVTDVGIKCHSYADVQMQMLRDDALALGTPLDDYEDLIALVESKIVPYVPPPAPAPEKIEALNGLLTLDAAGLSGAYEAWASSPDRTFAQKAFITKAIPWRRDDPTLAAAASELGLTDEQIDALFIQAATL